MKFMSELTPELIDFIGAQKVFFTATAAASGRINVSPKGCDTFRVLDSKTVAYLDLVGSGNETAAHILNCGRITIMFCAFEGKPLIVRLYGSGEVVRPDHPKWPSLSAHFPQLPGTRQIIVVHIESAQGSCGMAVPTMQFVEHRSELIDWAKKKGPAGIDEYMQKKNKTSIDGLPTSIK